MTRGGSALDEERKMLDPAQTNEKRILRPRDTRVQRSSGRIFLLRLRSHDQNDAAETGIPRIDGIRSGRGQGHLQVFLFCSTI